MTVVPVAYDIPEAILAGLASGEFMRFGSVVRDSKQIIMHLKEVVPPVNDLGPDGGLAPAMAAAHKNRNVLIGLGTITVLAAGGFAIWAATRSKKDAAQPEVPESAAEYTAALSSYLEAIQTGTLDSEKLDRLVAALDTLQQESESGEMKLEVSIEQSTALVGLVVDYTRKLAEANAVRLDDDHDSSNLADANPIVDLRQWLEVQKRILGEAA